MYFMTNISKISDEQQYLNLISNIIDNGIFEMGRNGNVKSIFGVNMRFDLTNNTIPFLILDIVLLFTKTLAFLTL